MLDLSPGSSLPVAYQRFQETTERHPPLAWYQQALERDDFMCEWARARAKHSSLHIEGWLSKQIFALVVGVCVAGCTDGPTRLILLPTQKVESRADMGRSTV